VTVIDDAVAVMVDLTDFADQAMEHTRSLHAAALRRTRNPDDAEHLLPEACLRACGGFARFEQGTNLSVGLHRIRTNTITSTNRSKQRRPAEINLEYNEHVDNLSCRSRLEATTMERSADDQLMDYLIDEQLMQAIDSIPRRFRLAVLLADVECLPNTETVERLDIPTGTVMSRGRNRDSCTVSFAALGEPSIRYATARRRGRCSSNREASQSRSVNGDIPPSCGVLHRDPSRLHGCDRVERSRYLAGSGSTNNSKENIMNVLVVGASDAIGTRKDLSC
jgi:RNA polymerase sigma-70 factor, ECF subfamily